MRKPYVMWQGRTVTTTQPILKELNLTNGQTVSDVEFWSLLDLAYFADTNVGVKRNA